ncbi:MAG: beta-ketoacyl-ACP synthase [Cyanobacteria bacterium P01_D01_bin.1]
MTVTKQVVVTGISLSTALGESTLENWTRLMAGESAIAFRQPFLDLEPMPLAMQGKQPVLLEEMITSLAQRAWVDAGWHEAAGEGCGVAVGSSRSHLQTLEMMALGQRQHPGQAEGNWLAALAHGPAVTVARTVGATGPLLAPMAACATGVWAIAQAADLIRTGQCERVIAGAVEAPITPLTIAGFRKMGALAKTGCYPFDVNREGFVLGEGGALMVLESETLAMRRGARIYGKILGVGLTNDSHHVSSFDPSYRMGRRAIALCLERSGLKISAVDAVHTHGTSTVQNDQMEASLTSELIAKRKGKSLPVMASKGATGHTLGAAGAVIVALGLLSLWQQQAIPCTGLQQAAFDLDFVQTGRAMTLQNILCFSFGFGGQNAVIALAARP